MTLIAYARVSADDQTTALQLDALDTVGAVQRSPPSAVGSTRRWETQVVFT